VLQSTYFFINSVCNHKTDKKDHSENTSLKPKVNTKEQNELKCLKNGSFGEEKFNLALGLLFIFVSFFENTGRKINSLLSKNSFNRVFLIFIGSIKVGDAVRHKRNAVRHEKNASRHKRNAPRHIQ
jgi:hypothetical protein